MLRLRDRMDQDLEIRGYSPSTRKIYVDCVAAFARHFDRPPGQLGPEDIRKYQLHLIEERNLSYSYFNQSVCALRFYAGSLVMPSHFVPYLCTSASLTGPSWSYSA